MSKFEYRCCKSVKQAGKQAPSTITTRKKKNDEKDDDDMRKK